MAKFGKLFNQYTTNARIMFLLSLLVFCTAFAYLPQLKKCDYKKRLIALKDKLIKTVLGEFAFDVLHSQNKNK